MVFDTTIDLRGSGTTTALMERLTGAGADHIHRLEQAVARVKCVHGSRASNVTHQTLCCWMSAMSQRHTPGFGHDLEPTRLNIVRLDQTVPGLRTDPTVLLRSLGQSGAFPQLCFAGITVAPKGSWDSAHLTHQCHRRIDSTRKCA